LSTVASVHASTSGAGGTRAKSRMPRGRILSFGEPRTDTIHTPESHRVDAIEAVWTHHIATDHPPYKHRARRRTDVELRMVAADFHIAATPLSATPDATRAESSYAPFDVRRRPQGARRSRLLRTEAKINWDSPLRRRYLPQTCGVNESPNFFQVVRPENRDVYVSGLLPIQHLEDAGKQGSGHDSVGAPTNGLSVRRHSPPP